MQLVRWYDWICEPNLQPGIFNFANEEYFQRGIEIFAELMRKRYTRTKPLNTRVTRTFWGMRAMLFRMKAEVEFSKILGEETTVERVEK